MTAVPRDKYDKPILAGDRIRYCYIGSYVGTVVRTRERQELNVQIWWDHLGNNLYWQSSHTLIVEKVLEQNIQDFFASVNAGEVTGRIGRAFLKKFGLTNRKLWDESCPGKAVKMIWKLYA